MDILSNSTIPYAGGLILLWWLYRLVKDRRSNPNRLPLPPGPKGYPIIGSLFDFPTYKPWLVYDKWFKTYGDMFYFEVLGQPFLVLGSVERTYDLFEKRSSNYSDRVRMPMLIEMMRWEYNMAFLPYGNWWRRHRRLFHDHFHPNIVDKYKDVQIDTARAFLRRLLKTPDDFMHHVRHAFGSSIVKVAYGITIEEENDPFVINGEIALGGLAEAGNPGTFLVDYFPIMKHIPDWFPGAGWKKKAAWWRHINGVVANRPWNQLKDQVKAGTAEPCIATTLIGQLPDEDAPNFPEEDLLSRDTCAVAFVGGADTTVSTVQSFFMAMCLYPEVQKKAKAELDNVLRGRLPEFNDRPNLPYINAMIKESMRWQLVLPLAVAHMCTNGDEYNGYYIPKGTIVIGNGWTILHDPEVFDDPLTYNPDRYLKDGKIDPTVRDPNVAFFGFGRRICPGRYFSENSLFTYVTHLLAVYDIRPGLDKDGKEVEIKPEMTNGLLSYPEPFSCRITPRSKEAEDLINNSSLMG
ncbi:cytochrome P450 [Macrolepiota fuliginosa MF-IS2]|uniref:Cytochrome P450 n=1 Tax=Macrolepiota fuliginosa MF-IS2 TaxID=1400762 RepID=A0A9P6C3B0_9AGAR|nr:cytochrome P450 [Macrolepiota fuliginosa MF-IS2]